MLFRPKFKDKVDNTVAVTYKHYEAFKTEGFVRFFPYSTVSLKINI